MYSDINSVRSDPLSPRYSRNNRMNSPIAVTAASQYRTDVNYQMRYQTPSDRWKNLLLPQIQQKYNEIMREKQGFPKRIEIVKSPSNNRLSSPESNHLIVNGEKSRVSVASRNSRVVGGSRVSNSRINGVPIDPSNPAEYQEKIDYLEEQNENLRQELYYLREALLLNFQTKEKVKQQSISSKSKIEEKTPVKKSKRRQKSQSARKYSTKQMKEISKEQQV